MPTVRKRTAPSGRPYWEAAVQQGGVRRWVTGRTRREVEEKLARLLVGTQRGRLPPPTKLTLAEWTETWLQGRDLAPATRRGYATALRPLLALLGDSRLDRLQPALLQSALARLRGTVGPRRLQMGYDVLRAVLNGAVRAEILSRNPLQAVARPRHHPQETPVWGPQEVGTFLRACRDDGRRPAVALALLVLTGLRVGELLGLAWADLDPEAGTLTVRQSLVWVGSRPVRKEPKSRTGHRTIALPPQAWAFLESLPRTAPSVFPTLRPRSLRAALARLCRKAGLPPLRPRDLRATHATLLAAAGLEVRAVQHRLGHADPQVTLRHYTRLLRDSERRAVEALERALARG